MPGFIIDRSYSRFGPAMQKAGVGASPLALLQTNLLALQPCAFIFQPKYKP
jgi:hypothetical protein